MGGAKVLDQGNARRSRSTQKQPECHGLDYIAGVIEYAPPTGFTPCHGVANRRGSTHQITSCRWWRNYLRSPKPDEFIDTQTTARKLLAGIVITSTGKGQQAGQF